VLTRSGLEMVLEAVVEAAPSGSGD
jgi:hypothetical protein